MRASGRDPRRQAERATRLVGTASVADSNDSRRSCGDRNRAPGAQRQVRRARGGDRGRGRRARRRDHLHQHGGPRHRHKLGGRTRRIASAYWRRRPLRIGTHRHESVRIDNQLRGRAGRQGDPGRSRFFVSLDDDLLRRYGIDQLVPRRLLEGDAAPAIRRSTPRWCGVRSRGRSGSSTVRASTCGGGSIATRRCSKASGATSPPGVKASSTQRAASISPPLLAGAVAGAARRVGDEYRLRRAPA